MRTINREIVSALIFSKDGKLFMGKKDPTKGGVYATAWHIPGGGVDEGESLEQALTREVIEEVGLDISGLTVKLVENEAEGESEKTLPDGEQVLAKMHFNVFKVELAELAASVPVRLNSDLVEYRWFDLSELSDVELTAPSQSLFKRLGYLNKKD